MSEPFKSTIRPFTFPAGTSPADLLLSEASKNKPVVEDAKADKDSSKNLKATKPQTKIAPQTLKSVKNYSIQGLSLVLETDEGFKELWIEPREVIQIPESFISQQMKNLHRRRLIEISN